VRLNHAEYRRHLFERAEVEWETRPVLESLHDYGWCIDNLHAALDWAFSPGGDAWIGMELAAAAVPRWMRLSLLDECRSRAEQALAACKIADGGDPRRAMKLYAALARLSFWGPAGVNAQVVALELGALWAKALKLAENPDDVDYQLRSLWNLYVFHLRIGDFQIALELAQRFRTLAAKQRKQNVERLAPVRRRRLLNPAGQVCRRPMLAQRRLVHDQIPQPLQVLGYPLSDDPRHHIVHAVHTFPAVEPEAEG
jgi:hypothetical protein